MWRSAVVLAMILSTRGAVLAFEPQADPDPAQPPPRQSDRPIVRDRVDRDRADWDRFDRDRAERERTIELRQKLREINREAYRVERERVRRPPPVLPVVRHERLTVAQLDPKTGELYWHDLLKHERYAAEREQIEAQFRDWARHKSLDREAVDHAARRLFRKLNSEIHNVRPRDYIAARNFVERIIHTAHFASS